MGTQKPFSERVSWKTLPELPMVEEVVGAQGEELPTQDIGRPFISKSQYLETQYHLLRHEGIECLRESVTAYREDPQMPETPILSIYEKVFVLGYLFTRLGAACRLSFLPMRCEKKIKWRNSTRLIPGTILAVSTAEDNFKSICWIATVASRPIVGGLEPDPSEDEHTPPRIDVLWADSRHSHIDPQLELVMVEAKSGFFEAVRWPMRGLQLWDEYETPFDKYIVNGDRMIGPPKYLEELDYVMNFTTIIRPGSTMNPRISLRDPFPPGLEDATGLDQSQLGALRTMLTRELAIVQGPPGTGKTFVSVTALSLLLHNVPGTQPIVIAAQTNNALDHLLRLCHIETENDFVRLGGRSRDETISLRTLFNLRQQVDNNNRFFSTIEAQRKRLIREMETFFQSCTADGIIDAKVFLESGIISEEQYNSLALGELGDFLDCKEPNSLADWLGGSVRPFETSRYNPPEGADDWSDVDGFDAREERLIDDDDRDKLMGQFIGIEDKWTGYVPSTLEGKSGLANRAERLLKVSRNMYQIQPQLRGFIYRYMRGRYLDSKAEEFRKYHEKFAQLAQASKECRSKSDTLTVGTLQIPIIGCTTTGLTKYRETINALKPRVMLIEEAAQTREANITSALFPSLEQVILIGDHMQLGPYCDVHQLAGPPHNLGVSLFERLIKCGLEYSALNVQRRMVPEIREIIQSFYPTLIDHPSVRDRVDARPPVPGMGTVDSFFFHHEWPDSTTRSSSRVNKEEALMVKGLIRYLAQNGVPCSSITILTYYNGQKGCIREQLKKDVVLGTLNPSHTYNISTIDGYQGEENDIIILSLVRSAAPGYAPRVGFLEEQNRAVVALSRARRGFYIFGNSNTLLTASQQAKETWLGPLRVLFEQGRLGRALPITCKKHGNISELDVPSDWERVHGGCWEPCKERYECGHACELMCHPYTHAAMICRKPCTKSLPCRHGCSELCGNPCKCSVGCSTVSGKSGQDKNFLELDDFLSARDAARPKPPSQGWSEHPAPGNDLINLDAVTFITGKITSVNKDWGSWDAMEHDAAIREEHMRARSETTVDEGPRLIEVYKRTQVNGGKRVTVEVTKKEISQKCEDDGATGFDVEVDGKSECSDLIEF